MVTGSMGDGRGSSLPPREEGVSPLVGLWSGDITLGPTGEATLGGCG